MVKQKRGLNPLVLANIRMMIKALPSVSLMLDSGQTVVYEYLEHAYKIERIAKTGIFSVDYHISEVTYNKETPASKEPIKFPFFVDEVDKYPANTKFLGVPLESGNFDLETYKDIKKTIIAVSRLLMDGHVTVYDLAINTDLTAAQIDSFLSGKNILSSTYYKLSNYIKDLNK